MMLAPVVQERKGEHVQLLEKLRSEGFIRVRINGKIQDLDKLPDLKLHKKHNIEIVIDRFRVRTDISLRLAESLETALRLSDGTVIIAAMDSPGESDVIYSARFACPQCGYSLSELEPRLFSFNNPLGACSKCDGLGIIQFFDSKQVVHNPDLSLSGGAVRGWDRRNAYYYQLIKSLADHYHFNIDTPFKNIPDKIQQIILYGSRQEENLVSIPDW